MKHDKLGLATYISKLGENIRLKRKSGIIFTLLIIIVLFGVAVFVSNVVENRQIPYIAFMSNHDRKTCLYICRNGDIYASLSEEAFLMNESDLIDKIRKNDYAGVLEYVGRTDARKVKEMHRLFSEVVLAEGYYVQFPSSGIPNSAGYDDEKWYWYGLCYDEEGEVEIRVIYISDKVRECSDKRAYEIVDWMYDVLKDYMN